jgi:hypothetical protein
MIKSIYITCFLYVLSFFVLAQNEEGSLNLLVKKVENIYSAVDENENYVLAFKTPTQFEFAFYDNANKKTGDILITVPSQLRKDIYLGLQLQNDSCTLYFFSEKTRAITQLNVIRASGQTTRRTVGELAYTDKYLKSVFLNNKFNLLTVTQGKSQINVHTVVDGKMQNHTYPIEMPDMYKRLSNGNNLLNEEADVTLGIDRIYYDIENNVKSSRATKKIYAFDQYIYLVFDDPDYSHVIQLNLEDNTSAYKQFLFNQDKGNNSSKKQGNSFLLNGILFRITMNPDQLTFTAIDINSNKTYGSFFSTPNNTINFKNGPIIQENSEDKHRVLEDNAAFYKKVLNSNLSIAVNQRDSIYIVEIGSYEEYVSNNYNGPNGGGGPNISIGMGMGMGMGMGGMGMGMGNMGYGGYPYSNYGWGSPGYYNGYNGYYPYNSSTTTIRTLYFHSMLDTSTFNHEEGIVPISLRERVSNFETGVFKDKKPELIRIVDFKEKILIGYLLPNKNIFQMYSFVK